MKKTKRTMFERISAAVLAILLVLSCVPASSAEEVYAAADDEYTVTMNVTMLDPTDTIPEDMTITVTDDDTEKELGTLSPNTASEYVTGNVKVTVEVPYGYQIVEAGGSDLKEDANSVAFGPISKPTDATNWSLNVTVEKVATHTVTYPTTSTGGTVRVVPNDIVSGNYTEVTKNDNNTSSLGIETEETVDIDVTAYTGYRISSVIVGGVEKIDSDVTTTSYSSTGYSISANTSIEVTFTKIYTVTVNYGSDSSVSVGNNSVSDGGTVSVDAGSENVSLTATPTTGYYVRGVTIDGANESLTDYLGGEYITTFGPITKDCVIAVDFAIYTYTVSAASTEHGSVSIGNSNVDYNDSTTVTITPADGYTVDIATVNEDSVTDKITKSPDGTISFAIDDITEDKIVAVTFEKTATTTESDNIEIGIADSLKTTTTSEAGTTYVIADGDKIDISVSTDSTLGATGIRALAADGSVIAGDSTSISISISDDTTISTIQLYYQADDEYYADWHTVTGIDPITVVVDTTSPTDLSVTYDIDEKSSFVDDVTNYKFYNGTMTVTLSATDEDSGVASFKYSTDGGATEKIIGSEKITYNGDTATATFEIAPEYRGSISFEATDKAGNVIQYTSDGTVVVVDTIAPKVKVSYATSADDTTFGVYNSSVVTATITINEANFFGDDDITTDEDLTKYLTVQVGTKSGGTYNYTSYGNDKLDFILDEETGTYSAKIEFTDDNDYKLLINYTDRSGNVADVVDEYSQSFVVDKTAPELSISYTKVDNTSSNEDYYNDYRTATISVTETNFDPSTFTFDISAKDVKGGEIDLTDYEEYLQTKNNWTQDDPDVWTATIELVTEGNYELEMSYSDLAGNSHSDDESSVTDTFCIDKTIPSELSISYSKNYTLMGKVLETITFGFYKAPVTVTLQATDTVAGVDYFTYKIDEEDTIIDSVANTDDASIATASFIIDAEFRNTVSFTATDMSGNVSGEYSDEKEIVVDTTAPVIEVTYTTVDGDAFAPYNNATVTAKIAITEANFFAESLDDGKLVIKVTEISNDGGFTEKTYTSNELTFNELTFDPEGDVHTTTIKFENDADYTFDIAYTDYSDNKAATYKTDEFTVDNISPEISVSYDNDSALNSKYFSANRTATIVIDEHNFDAADVVATITASDTGVDTDAFTTYLQEASNWTTNGDVHTATITFDEESDYTFDIKYTDLAGNANTTVDYGTSVAPTTFTLDKSAPTDLSIEIDGMDVLGSNNIAFDTFYAEEISIELDANCDISGLDFLSYQKVTSISEYDESATWTSYNADTGIVVTPSEKCIIYFKAVDKAGNATIVNSTGIVVDNQMPTGEINAPEIDIILEETNENGMYNEDVTVDLTVVEPAYIGSSASDAGYYSGLNEITYKIYTTDTDAVETGTLLSLGSITSGAVYDADDLISEWSNTITIDADTFNSNKVMIEVIATDNAGNQRITTTTVGDIKIDVTAPTIDIAYSNNSADSTSYFDAPRTATITVTERNFSSDDMNIVITNTDGSVPSVSSWSKVAGTGNGDDTKWVATVTYAADGDYTFAIAYTDLADNTCRSVDYGESVAPTSFTIDQTIPTVSVSYGDESATNTNYYSELRTATVTITEHNIDPNGADADRVVITMTAEDDGVAVATPTVSYWNKSGDTYTATIGYSSDALYTFDVAITDKAGNASVDFEEQTFYVDTTTPVLEITGVENNSANNGDVIPVLTYSDTNIDLDSVSITLTGANREEVTLDGSYATITNGQVFTFANFEEIESVDDIYTLEATLTDMAGNTITESIVFSVNRFGSTYAMSDETEEMNNTYVQNPVDVVVYETNPDELALVKITLFKNNETVTLEEGVDYTMELEGGAGEWHKYIYTIDQSCFADDGVYRITFYSEDASGNIAENTLDTKEMEVSFGVDKTSPTVVVSNLESDTTYAVDSLDVNMSVNDNLSLTTVVVYLDDETVAEWNAEDIATLVTENADYTFTINGASTESHFVKIVGTDAAGNQYTEEISDFYVTTNLWVRYYTNKALFYGSIITIVALVVAGTGLIVFKRKKQEVKTK